MRFAHLLSFFFLTQWTAYAISQGGVEAAVFVGITGLLLVVAFGHRHSFPMSRQGQKKFIESGIDLEEVNRKLEPTTAKEKAWWKRFSSDVQKEQDKDKTGKASEGKKSNEGSLNHGTPDGVAGGTTKDSPPKDFLSDASKAVSQPPARTGGQVMNRNPMTPERGLKTPRVSRYVM